jgi:hypothetical protein
MTDYKFAPIPQDMLHLITKVSSFMKASTITVLLYQLDQEFGYLDEDGNVKDGDSSGYGHIGKRLNMHKDTSIKAMNELVKRNIVEKTIQATKYGNYYKINRNLAEWISGSISTTSSKKTGSSKNTTSYSNQLHVCYWSVTCMLLVWLHVCYWSEHICCWFTFKKIPTLY